MHKLLDYKIKIPLKDIQNYIKKEKQLENIDLVNLMLIEAELFELLNNSVLSLSCNIEEDSTVSITPSLFNGNSIVKNKNVLIQDDYIINE